MENWYIVILCIVIGGLYIYKISYFYDYKYVLNVIRFVLLVLIGCTIIINFADDFKISIENNALNFAALLASYCVIICSLFTVFLRYKFGTEERYTGFENETDKIGKK